jgi:hypothetical protein
MFLFGGNVPWDTPLGVYIRRKEDNFKILVGKVFVMMGEYQRQVIVKSDEIWHYCIKGLQRFVLPEGHFKDILVICNRSE